MRLKVKSMSSREFCLRGCAHLLLGFMSALHGTRRRASFDPVGSLFVSALERIRYTRLLLVGLHASNAVLRFGDIHITHKTQVCT